MTRRPRRTYTAEFKQQIVNLYKQGKSATDIIREYDLTASLFSSMDKLLQSITIV